MKRLALALVLGSVLVFGVYSLCISAPGGTPGRPCIVDPNLQCLLYMDPVTCIKPGEGRKTYSNACFAMKDCALMHTCRPAGGGPVVHPVELIID